MSACVLMTVEGVLTQGEDLKTAVPIKLAKPLYDSFRGQFRMVALTRADQEFARWWLNRERFMNWSTVLTWNQAMTWDFWREDIVRDFLANAWEIAFFIDGSLVVADKVREMGVSAFVPRYPIHHPGWQPDPMGPRPWGEVAATLDFKA